MDLGITHSIATADAIGRFVAENWDIGPIEDCVLVRSYANDVYRLKRGNGDFVVKVYRRGWRNAWDVGWEAQLCAHLDGCGVSVSVFLPARDGTPVQAIEYPEGERAVTVSQWLAGTKPVPPWTDDLYRDFGRATARLHLASQSFAPSTPGRLLNADHLIRRPVAKLAAPLADRPEQLFRLQRIAERVAGELDRLAPSLPFGACHGDVSLDNIHIDTDGRIAFFDFDLGGHGWFDFDFNGVYRWSTDDPDAIRFWTAFQQGYGEIRPIREAELRALPLFDIAYLIWDLEHVVNNWTTWTGSWVATDEIVTANLAEVSRRYESM
jgi:Ser/Thr protein kinase RdoA (MazF antagonist)